MLAGPNAIHPDRLTVEERLSDVAEILAHGLRRYMAREGRSAPDACNPGAAPSVSAPEPSLRSAIQTFSEC